MAPDGQDNIRIIRAALDADADKLAALLADETVA